MSFSSSLTRLAQPLVPVPMRNDGRTMPPPRIPEISQVSPLAQAPSPAVGAQIEGAAPPPLPVPVPDWKDMTPEERLNRYQALPAPAERPPALGLEGLPVGSTPEDSVALLRLEDMPQHVVGSIGTPPIVAEIKKSGGANFLNPAWMEQVASAAEQNGGLGNAQDGFLAFSEQYGFVRLRHPGLTPEQNQRLAEISLQTGWPIEKLPSRTSDSALDDPKINDWVDSFIGKFDTELADFAADPVNNGISMKSGRNRYKLEYNEQAGGFVSYHFRKASGLKGFTQKALKYVGPVLDGIAMVGRMIPGVGWAASAIATGAKFVMNTIATGKVQLQNLVSTVGSFFAPGVGSSAAVGLAGLAAGYAETGKLSARGVVGALAPLIPGLPGGTEAQGIFRQALNGIAEGIDRGSFRPEDFLGVLKEFLPALSNSLPEGVRDLAQGIDNGLIDPDSVAGRLADFIREATEDKELRKLVGGGLRLAWDAVRGKDVAAEDIVKVAVPYISELIFGSDAPPADAERAA